MDILGPLALVIALAIPYLGFFLMSYRVEKLEKDVNKYMYDVCNYNRRITKLEIKQQTEELKNDNN